MNHEWISAVALLTTTVGYFHPITLDDHSLLLLTFVHHRWRQSRWETSLESDNVRAETFCFISLELYLSFNFKNTFFPSDSFKEINSKSTWKGRTSLKVQSLMFDYVNSIFISFSITFTLCIFLNFHFLCFFLSIYSIHFELEWRRRRRQEVDDLFTFSVSLFRQHNRILMSHLSI